MQKAMNTIYRGECSKCGLAIDILCCKHVTDGYICSTCRELHPIKFYFIRMANVLDKKSTIARFHSNSISAVVKALGNNGWIPSELAQITFDEERGEGLMSPLIKVTVTT